MDLEFQLDLLSPQTVGWSGLEELHFTHPIPFVSTPFHLNPVHPVQRVGWSGFRVPTSPHAIRKVDWGVMDLESQLL